jgi:hypothetical protein
MFAAVREPGDGPWKRLESQFSELTAEENRTVQQRGLSDWCYAYVTGLESGTFDYLLESIPSESLQVRFEGLATEAGIALGSPPGTPPITYWLHRLFLDLRANKSPLIGISNDTTGFIEHLFEASAVFCARLSRQSLEKAAMSCEDGEGTAGQRATEGVIGPPNDASESLGETPDALTANIRTVEERALSQWPGKPEAPNDAASQLPRVVGTVEPGRASRIPRRRTPDLEKSRERLAFLGVAATELATIKQDLKGHCTAKILKNKHPRFVIWEYLSKQELQEIVDGEAFAPRTFAENLTLRKFGITSRETLKKDRHKIKRADRGD